MTERAVRDHLAQMQRLAREADSARSRKTYAFKGWLRNGRVRQRAGVASATSRTTIPTCT